MNMMKVNGTQVHAVSGLPHRVNTFVINFNFKYYSANKLF